MSLYDGAQTSVRVVKVGIDRGPVLSLFLCAAVVNVVTELAREGVLS